MTGSWGAGGWWVGAAGGVVAGQAASHDDGDGPVDGGGVVFG